ncbi:MAG: T9SS type A sorting domain-containing protein, partial [Flavobacteriales bacterium]|nr:T9SS type A sorting domain-containing protein [Flavobacteriales bacterium]
VGTHTITYKHTNANSCTDSASKTITVDTLPTVTFSVLSAVCINQAGFNLSGGTPTGGSYSGSGVTSGVFTPSVAGIGSHKIAFTYTDGNGCSDSDTSVQVVNGLPTVSMTALNSICAGSPGLLLSGGAPSGGVYSGTGVSSGMFYPSTAGAGTHKITYEYTDINNCSDTTSKTILVHTQPTVSFAPISDRCANSPTFNLSGGLPTGGTYRMNHATVTTVNPSAIGKGIHSIAYIYTDANTCTDSATRNFTIDSVPTVTFGTLASVCSGSTSFVVRAGSPLGGKYKGTGMVNDTVFSSALAGTGTHSLRYIFTDGRGCVDSANQTIGVDTLPAVAFSIQDSVCQNSDSLLLIGVPSGGTFTGTTVNNVHFYPTISPKGYQRITYTVTGGNGCMNTATDSIRVDTVTSVQFSLLDSICANSNPIALNTGVPSGGTYSGGGVVSGVYTPSSIGNVIDSVKYKLVNAYGCSDSTFEQVRVDSITTVSMSALSPICDNDSLVLNNGLPLGGIYSGKDVTAGLLNPVDSGNFRIRYDFTNAFGCVDSTFGIIKVKGAPKAKLLTLGAMCANAPVTKLTNGIPLGGNYYGAAIVNGNYIDPSLVGPGNTLISYTLQKANGCKDSVTTVVSIDTLPTVTLDSIPLQCINKGVYQLTEGKPLGGVYSGTGVSSGKFDPAIGRGNYQVKYSYVNLRGCMDSAKRLVEVDTLRMVLATNENNLCQGTEVFKLSGGLPLGGIYSGPNVYNDSLFNGKDLVAGTVLLNYSIGSRCGRDTNSFRVRVLPLPEVSLDSIPLLCEGKAKTIPLFYGKPAGGTHWVGGEPSNQILVKKRVSQYEVFYSYTDAKGCTGWDTAIAKVAPTPSTEVAGKLSLCSGDSLSLTAAPDMKYYIWNGDTSRSNYYMRFDSLTYGIHSTHLKVVSNDGCTAEETIDVRTKNCGNHYFVYPNPTNGRFTFYYESDRDMEITLAIYNYLGKPILLKTELVETGLNEFIFDVLNQSAGVYVLQIGVGVEVFTEKIVIN